MRTRTRGTVAVATCLVLALCGIGAAPVPQSAPSALCIPLLMQCGTTPPTPTPAPTPSPTSTPTGPLGGLGSVLGGGSILGGGSVLGGSSPVGSLAQAIAVADPTAPVMTLPAAQLGGSSISFTGLQSVTLVTVPLVNGTRTPVLKLVADTITIDDFVLDVRPASGTGALVTNSGTMELRGNVTAYLDSVSGTLLDGTGLTLGAANPPPGGELPSTLLRVTLGLVGVTADSISLIPSHEAVK